MTWRLDVISKQCCLTSFAEKLMNKVYKGQLDCPEVSQLLAFSILAYIGAHKDVLNRLVLRSVSHNLCRQALDMSTLSLLEQQLSNN